MNVASLENCKELYKLSGWCDTDKAWRDTDRGNEEAFVGSNNPDTSFGWGYPAYDAGFLLQKLLVFIELSNNTSDGSWLALNPASDEATGAIGRCFAHTPEDALCKLAIELFKSGVLTATPKKENE